MYGPVTGSGGEYLLVVQCLYSRFPAVEIISSTGHKAVIPALDRIMSAFGIPDKLGSHNGPSFNEKEFHAFARYTGFQFDPVTPLAPWANGTVERFMPNLTKVLQTVKEEGHNWRQELQRYLRAYRSTQHSSTGFSPAHLLFNGRKYKTKLPNDLRKTILVAKKQVQLNDQCVKRKMKEHADTKSYVRPID